MRAGRRPGCPRGAIVPTFSPTFSRPPDPTARSAARSDRPIRPPDPSPRGNAGKRTVEGRTSGRPHEVPVHRLQGPLIAGRSCIKVLARSDDDHRVENSAGDLSDEVDLACLDQVNRSTRRGALFAPIGAGALVLVFAGTVPLAGLLVWAVSATLVSVATVWCAELYLRRRRAGLEVGRWRIGPLSSARMRVGVGVPAILRFSLRTPLRPTCHLPDIPVWHLRGQRGGDRSTPVLLLLRSNSPCSCPSTWSA